MIYNSKKHHRRSIRLNNYDYSNTGFYFITICTQNQSCLFGKIENEELLLNDADAMIQAQWINLISRYNQIKLHEFIVMPNHFHGIIEFVGVPLVGTQNTKGSQTAEQPQGIAPTVGDVMGALVVSKIVAGYHLIKKCGNVIIMNTLSGMKNRIWKLQSIYNQII